MKKEHVVRCPNLCWSGKVASRDSIHALYDLIQCVVCKGNGFMTQQEAEKKIKTFIL